VGGFDGGDISAGWLISGAWVRALVQLEIFGLAIRHEINAGKFALLNAIVNRKKRISGAL